VVLQDDTVPWGVGQALLEALVSDDVVLSCVKDGDHRLSRPQDLELLKSVVGQLMMMQQH
jgi:hypothetical protein